MSGPIELVAFDAVGTVIRLREPVGETYARRAAGHGVRVPARRLEDGFRRILRAAPPMVFPGEGPDATRRHERAWWRQRVRETFKASDQTVRFADFDAFFDALFAHYASGAAWQTTPGARDALARLRDQGRRLAVASNFDQRLESILQDLDLDGFFETLWLPARAGAAKPDPAFFTGLLDALGVAPEAAVHVGDDPDEDLAAARRAGLHAVAVEPPATLHDLPERIRMLEGGGI